MAIQAIQSVNQPHVSILLNGVTTSIRTVPSTTENNDAPTTSTHGPAHNTPRPRIRIVVPDQPRRTASQGSRRQRRRGSPPPPPSPPHNTPTLRFGAEPQGPSVQRGRRALQRLSSNGLLRPSPRPRHRQRANRTTALELENAGIVATNNNATNVQDDARRATTELERTMLNDPYAWSRESYPANWAEYNDRIQHTEEPGWLFGA